MSKCENCPDEKCSDCTSAMRHDDQRIRGPVRRDYRWRADKAARVAQKRRRVSRITAMAAAVELRAMLAGDAAIPRRHRRRLLGRATVLVRSASDRPQIVSALNAMISRRFGRNPDTFELSDATIEAIILLSKLQKGNL